MLCVFSAYVCQHGRTALELALLNGNEEVVQALINASPFSNNAQLSD